MEPTTDQLEDDIRKQRAALNSDIDELEQKVKSATDWRQQYRKSPGTFLAVAAGGGLMLALMTRRPRGPIALQTTPARPASAPRNPQIEKSIGVFKSALIGVAANHAKSILSQFIPGFEREYDDQKQDEPTTQRPNNGAHNPASTGRA